MRNVSLKSPWTFCSKKGTNPVLKFYPIFMPFLTISAAFAYLLNYLANDTEKIQKCTLSIIYENYFIFIALKLSGEKQKKNIWAWLKVGSCLASG